ncbi:BrnT family toxin [Salinarimonas chemoclinalis]|uniref:BrnT family toxin n=1 Tax=Salinarimonas chemoclinalis TaxID=3241599 RepID=UPI0035577CF0
MKAASNEAKHCVAFEEASLVFLDPSRVTWRDGRHHYGELRLRTVGRCGNALLFVCYTIRGGCNRLISARLANRGERRLYEDGPGGGRTWRSSE